MNKSVIKHHQNNPILTKRDILYPEAFVHHTGAIKNKISFK